MIELRERFAYLSLRLFLPLQFVFFVHLAYLGKYFSVKISRELQPETRFSLGPPVLLRSHLPQVIINCYDEVECDDIVEVGLLQMIPRRGVIIITPMSYHSWSCRVPAVPFTAKEVIVVLDAS